PDKEQAWNDLIRLTGHQDSDVRFKAAVSLGAAFPFVPDKEKAWNDLIRLTGVKDIDVQWGVAVSLGAAFPFASDKKQAWNDLIRPTENENYKLWGPANYALGRVSIIKATEAESKENIRKEIETALAFFEKASEGMSYDIPNPAKFCKLFYRSWYMITFKQTREAEVQKYLAEAKYIAEGSESKERLLEAVENLANALREAQKSRQKGLDAMKSDLNAIRKYCERAAEILATTEEKAPGATKLIKRGLPIIGETIKEIIGEIKDKAEVVCRQTKGTPLEYLGFELYRQGHNLSLKIRDPIGLEKGVDNLLLVLSDICANMSDEVRGGACKLLDMAKKEPYIEDKLHLINIILSKIPPQMSISRLGQKLDDLMIRLKPGIRAELTTSGGLVVWGSGMQLKITIPLQEIPYPEFKEDLEEIKRKGVIKLASPPPKLAKIVKDYLILDLLKR
ncbi:MAG: hypothetical protein QMD80_06780, partial [archaeon]|nr:hypothetical protein [archaeon]